ncbi:MAG: two-component system OmpR family heavy metal sensor histidine kinase CusS [Comamonadaceae bacterium]|nr:MAG: two-component system OmpR family heavy metal sensor histidine kinase CusS [Comamonadaceae bacterium]
MKLSQRLPIATQLAWLFALFAWLVFGICGAALLFFLSKSLQHERQHAQRTKLEVVMQMLERTRAGGRVSDQWLGIEEHLNTLHHTDRSTYYWVFCQERQGKACSTGNDTMRTVALAATQARGWQSLRFDVAGVQPMGSESGEYLQVLGHAVRGLPAGDQVLVLVGTDGARARATLSDFAWLVAVVVVCGGLATALLGWVLARWALRPLRKLSDAARTLGPDRLTQRLDLPPKPTELFPLVQSFNAALDRMEAAFRQLETFNANVAHELRSPLATLIGATQVALLHPRSVDALQEVLSDNLEDLERLAAVVRDMLFLARADHGERADAIELLDVRVLAEETAEFFESLLAESGTKLDLHGHASLQGNTGLLQRALSNLLMNAMQYAQTGTPIQITMGIEHGQCELAVLNQGQPIDEATRARMFDRFYRADGVRTQGSGHVGLGLAIVRAVAQMHGGSVFADSEQGVNRIGMRLPLTQVGS